MIVNTAGQAIFVYVYTLTVNLVSGVITKTPVTGDAANIVGRVSKDFTGYTALTNAFAEIDSINDPGYYGAPLEQVETNAATLHFNIYSNTADTFVECVQNGGITPVAASFTSDVITPVLAIKTTTDNFVFTVANQVDSNVKSISDDSTAADRLEALMDGIVVAQVNGVATTTSIPADGFTEATDDHFNGRLITFISGALSGQQTSITDYTGSTQTFTVAALTEAPPDNVFFVIH